MEVQLLKIHSDTRYSIDVDLEHSYIICTHKSKLPEIELSEIGNKTLEIMEKYQITKILFDLRTVKGSMTGQNDYWNNDFGPKARALGLSATAYVIKDNVFLKFSLNFLFKLLASKQVERKIFTDFEEATSFIMKG